MSTHPALTRAFFGLIASTFIYWAAASAAEPPAPPAEPSKEMRAKMASAHERMAACLRSDKSITECRSEMMKSCREVMGEHGCPMMGMGMGMGMRHEGMKDPGASVPKDK
jgi:hypothetical protein